MKLVKNFLEIPSIILFLYRCYKQQKQFMKESVLLDLETFKKSNDGSLNEKDFKKISYYYGLAVPVIGEIFCLLRGSKISIPERKTLSYLGGSTGLFDDFFDIKQTSLDHIKKLINHPDIEIGRNSHEKLFLHFYLKALEQERSELIMNYSNLVYDAQILSKTQLNTNLTSEEILNITQQKGGISILFYRVALDGQMTEVEEQLLFKIGLVGQLENDIFDIYKDYQDGIHTLASTSNSMTDLKSRFQSILNEVYELIDKTDFKSKNKKKFSRMVAIIATRGLVCLDQLIKLENNGRFEIEKHARKELICDMGSFKNNLKWIGFYLRWNS